MTLTGSYGAGLRAGRTTGKPATFAPASCRTWLQRFCYKQGALDGARKCSLFAIARKFGL